MHPQADKGCMLNSTVVRVTHRYQLPVQRAFDAWLTPALAGRFLFATRTGNILHCEIDPQVGGRFTVTDRRPTADGDESFFEAQHHGVFIQIERPRKLVFDLRVEPYSDQATRVSLDFTALGDNLCEIVLIHELGASEDARANAERARLGWVNMLSELDKVLSTRSWGVNLETAVDRLFSAGSTRRH